ncbi:DoxX family protein [Pseudoalteromonas fenneropenaei]|uniref:DoxX family protein n=1 Tax=Pseudoalteromonas fenneropenaei TaxID=1737459 RepID=A0ABV7CJZ9_9GAMM
MSTSPAIAALLLRLSLGVMFIAHGLLKLMVFTPAGTAGFFGSIGLPEWLGPVTMAAELVGGLLLIAGVQVRLVVVALLPALIGSIVFVHGANGWGFGNPGGGYEYPLFLIAASTAQWFLGNGAYALQDLLPLKRTPQQA